MIGEIDLNYVYFCDADDSEKAEEIAKMWELMISLGAMG